MIHSFVVDNDEFLFSESWKSLIFEILLFNFQFFLRIAIFQIKKFSLLLEPTFTTTGDMDFISRTATVKPTQDKINLSNIQATLASATIASNMTR